MLTALGFLLVFTALGLAGVLVSSELRLAGRAIWRARPRAGLACYFTAAAGFGASLFFRMVGA